MIGFRRQRIHTAVVCGVAVIVLAVIASVLVWVPEKMVAWVGASHDPQYATIVDKYRSTLSQAIGGLLVLIGLYFTARNVFAAEQTRLTKTFSDAITQLGSVDKDGVAVVPVRLGGIYALERLSRDSPQDAYVICRILSQYIQVESSKGTGGAERKGEAHAQPDMEAALIVLGIITQGELLKRGETLHFFDVFLPNLTLGGRSFATFHFHRSTLAGSRLDTSDCTNTRFENCNLLGCSFANCTMANSELNRVEGHGLNLSGAHIDRTNFFSCDMHDVDFTDSSLNQCRFSDSDLRGSVFARASLVGAVMSNTNLSNVSFDDADLSRADFRTAVGLSSEQLVVAKRQPDPSNLPPYLLVSALSDTDQ